MNVTAVCDSFAADAVTAMLGTQYMVALIRNGATGTYDEKTANYSQLAGDEVRGAGYRLGGAPLKNARLVLRDGRACIHFDDVSWPGADIFATGALIYRKPDGRAAAVLDFGGTHAATGGATFVLPMDCPIRL